MPEGPSLSLGDLAKLVGASVPPECLHEQGLEEIFTGCASLEDAGPDEVSFFSNPRYLAAFKMTRAGAVLVPEDLPRELTHGSAILLRVANPSSAFSDAVHRLRPAVYLDPLGIHPTAAVDPSAELDPSKVSIGPLTHVGAGARIGNGSILRASVIIGNAAVVGENCLLHYRVTVADHCILGNRVILNSGCVVGSDGFGYESVNGRHQKIEQVGIVQIDDDVEIGANSTIDRARFGRTWIQEGVKIDNLVMVAHNVVIGKHSIIVAQTGIAGSTRLGDHCVAAAQCGMAGHLTIAAGTTLAARTAVIGDIDAPGHFLGFPARPYSQTMRSMALFEKLPELWKRLRAVERRCGL